MAKVFEALLDEPATADSPWGDTCAECGEPLGTEFIYEMDGEQVTAAYHKHCKPEGEEHAH